jgi:HK97 family phage major capsid protein
MAFDPVNNVENWIAEEHDSDVLRAVDQTSAIERIARRYPMATDAKQIPRSGGVSVGGVNKGGTYGVEAVDAQAVTLVAKKFGTVSTVNQEDLEDPHVSVLDQIRLDWARSYAITLDNACLGVSGDADSTTRPFISAYRSLTSSNTQTGYTANANVVAPTGDVTYNDISELLAIMEQSNYYDPGKLRVIAHPGARQVLRNIKDDQGRPIFVYGQGTDGSTPNSLFGELPVEFSLGARVSSEMTDNPTGKKLLYVVNTDFLALGMRSGPESAIAGADSGPAFMTDQALLKMRARRGFALTMEHAAAVLVFD